MALPSSRTLTPQEWLRDRGRAWSVLLAFGLRASPAQWITLFVATVVGPLAGLAGTYATKLLTDAVLAPRWDGVLFAAALETVAGIVASLCGDAYVRLVIQNGERAGELIDRHLIALIAGIPG